MYFFFIVSEKCEVLVTNVGLELLACGLHFRTARLHSAAKSRVTSEQNDMVTQAKLVLRCAHFPFIKAPSPFLQPFPLCPSSHSSSQCSALSVQKKISHYCCRNN